MTVPTFEQLRAGYYDELGRGPRKRRQDYHTPDGIARAMADWVLDDEWLERTGGADWVVDPMCGVGTLLHHAAERLAEHGVSSIRTQGYDINPEAVEVAQRVATECSTRGIRDLATNTLEGFAGRRYSRMLLNPPFDRAGFWIAEALKLLAPDARACIVAPAGYVEGPNDLPPIVGAAVRLPAGAFAEVGTGVCAYLLMVELPGPIAEVRHWSVDAKPTKRRPLTRADFDPFFEGAGEWQSGLRPSARKPVESVQRSPGEWLDLAEKAHAEIGEHLAALRALDARRRRSNGSEG